MEDVTKMSTAALDRDMEQFVVADRTMQWKFMLRLVEFDRRRGWGDYGSLFVYLTKRHGLAEGTAYHRMLAVGILKKFPQAIDYLRTGRLWISNLVLLADVLNEENVGSLLDRAAGKSKSDVLALAKSMKKPIGVPAPLVRRASNPIVEAAPGEEHSDASNVIEPHTESVTAAESLFAPRVAVARKGEASHVAANQHLIRMFVDDEFMTLLDRAKHIVSHSIANGDITLVLKRGLAELVEKHERRLSPTRLCRVNQWDPERREIPIALWREVMTRDDEKCAWEFEAGGLCGSRWQIQVDHIVAAALGGLTILENLRVLCRSHNLEHARRTFGAELIDKMIRRQRRA